MTSDLITVAQQVLVLFAMMGLGAWMRKVRMLKDAAVESVVDMILIVVTPCLIAESFQRPFDPSMMKGLGLAFAFSVAGYLSAIVLACLLVRHRNEDSRATLRMAAVFSNAGCMGIPMEQALLGMEGVFYGAVYIVVLNLFVWSWGYWTMRREADGAGRPSLLKCLVNPGTVGIAFGLPLFLFSVKLPEFIAAPVHHIANLNTPLGMIVIGYCLVGVRFGRLARMAGAYVAAFVRLVAGPLAMLALVYPFRHHLDRSMMLALVIAASAPVAATVSMFAAKFRRDVETSVVLVSATTLLSMLTMPVVIAFAMQVL